MNKLLRYLLLSVSFLSSSALANISEPDVVFYGKVSVRLGSTNVGLYSGDLNWVIRHRNGDDSKEYVFSTNLESLADGKYSYKINIPQQLLVDADTFSSTPVSAFVTASKKELLLKHYNITLNGKPVILADSHSFKFAAGESFRSNHQRLDLIVSNESIGNLLDQDDDGLPDLWEQHFGLQIAISDANADPDGDGWTNLEEYQRGTDPSVNNRIPILAGENGEVVAPSVTLYENGLVQLRLSVTDSDSQTDDLTIVLDTLPHGVQVYHVDNMDQPLAKGGSIAVADFSAGKLFARYLPEVSSNWIPVVAEPGGWLLSLHDDGPMHIAEEGDEEAAENAPVAVIVDLKVFRPSLVGEPLRWIDGMAYRGQSVSSLNGRSGRSLDSLSTYQYDQASSSIIKSDDNIVIDQNGLVKPDTRSGMFAFEEPVNVDDRLDLSGNQSLFAVYKASNTTEENTIFTDGSVYLSKKEGRLAFGSTDSLNYIGSPDLGAEGIQVVAVHTQGTTSVLEASGVPLGGPRAFPENEVYQEPSVLVGFGHASDEGWVSGFNGQLGEFIAFPSALESMDKWSVNAYLLSKWRGYSVLDARYAADSVQLLADEGLPLPVIMLGGIADDSLTSNGQDSVLFGGAGRDRLTGGSGRDRFVVTNGDTVEGFKSSRNIINTDILDFSELLRSGAEPLERCLFSKPTGIDTTIFVNQQCEGSDFVAGSDFTDAFIIIEGQALSNAELFGLWNTGELFSGHHRPGVIQAQVSIDGQDTQRVNISETSGDEWVHQRIYLSYTGDLPYIGKGLELPLLIDGTATAGEDYILTMERGIYPGDDALVNEITNGLYSFNDLFNLSNEQLRAIGITPNFSSFGFIHTYNLMGFGGWLRSRVYLPAQPTDFPGGPPRFVFDLAIKRDGIKEDDETITLKLEEASEYYSLVPDKDEITITITDGLDKVYLSDATTTVSEGQQGQFTLYRTGSIDQPLFVDVSFSGLAVNGGDYSAIPSQLMFEKGEDTLVVPVRALADDVSESIELAEMRVISSDQYEVDMSRNLAQIYIQDEALKFADTDKDGMPNSWELAMGLNPNISNQKGEGFQDSDNDGLNDIDEYYLGTHPMRADSDGDGVVDGDDADPLDNTTKDATELSGYQIVRTQREEVINVPLGLDRIIEIPLEYLTSDGSDQATGLGLILQYNADQLEYLGVDRILPVAHASTGEPTPNVVYRGGYKLFTHQVPITWDAVGRNWPGLPLPAKLLNVRFKVLDSASVGQQYMVGVGSQSAAAGYAFKPSRIMVNVVPPTGMDILVNGTEDSADESVILARHLAGLSPQDPNVFIDEKLPEDELTRIRHHINGVGLLYDVDGDGVVNPLSDAVLIYHFLKNGVLEEDQVKGVLGNETNVRAVDVVARIREIQRAQ